MEEGTALESSERVKTRKWGKQLFQLVALILVCWGIWHSIRNSTAELAKQRSLLEQQADELQEQADQTANAEAATELRSQSEALRRESGRFWKAAPLGLLAASLLYAAAMLPSSLYWRRCLVELDQVHDLFDTLWAFFYGNLGKYFPGKAMVIVLRLGALQHHGIKKTATAMTIFMETLTMMSVGGAVGAICMIILNIDWRLTVLAIGLLVATLIPTAPPVLQFLLPRLQKGVEPHELSKWTSKITWGLFARGWMMLAVGWLLNGLSLMFVLQSLPSADLARGTKLPQARSVQKTLDIDNDAVAERVSSLAQPATDASHPSWTVAYISALGACALAVVLGFVSLVPGGAGVREVVISMVLAPVVGPVAALCGALWLRIVWLITELSVVGVLGVLKHLGFGYRPEKQDL